jgi:hypothetical protein
MRTKQLKEIFKTAYENFFAQQKIIFSAPFIMSWT